MEVFKFAQELFSEENIERFKKEIEAKKKEEINTDSWISTLCNELVNSGIWFEVCREDMHSDWKATIDSRIHDEQVRKEVLEKVLGMAYEDSLGNKVINAKKVEKLKEQNIVCKTINPEPKKEYKSVKVTEIIEKTCESVCDNFCKYRETCDENNECEWERQGNECPLDKLF